MILSCEFSRDLDYPDATLSYKWECELNNDSNDPCLDSSGNLLMDYSINRYDDKFLVIDGGNLAAKTSYKFMCTVSNGKTRKDTASTIITTTNRKKLPSVSITPLEWKNKMITWTANALTSQVVTQFPISQAIITWK
jgi:hypothetical protein